MAYYIMYFSWFVAKKEPNSTEEESSGSSSSSEKVIGVVIGVVVSVIIVIVTISSVSVLVLRRCGVKCTKTSAMMYIHIFILAVCITVLLNLLDFISEVKQRKVISRQKVMMSMWKLKREEYWQRLKKCMKKFLEKTDN